jgi:hypothetical protein
MLQTSVMVTHPWKYLPFKVQLVFRGSLYFSTSKELSMGLFMSVCV